MLIHMHIDGAHLATLLAIDAVLTRTVCAYMGMWYIQTTYMEHVSFID